MSFAEPTNRDKLLSLKASLPAASKPEYREVKEGDRYKITRYKTTEYVVVHEVKASKIKLKRNAEAVDSFTISRAEFDKYYVKA